LLAVSSLLSGCSACSRDLESSVPAPISGSMPPASSHAAPPAPPDSEPSDGSTAHSEIPTLAMSADFLQIGALNQEMVKWGPGTFQDDKGRSTACIGLQQQYEKYNVAFIGPEDSNTITLSFDQGYENGYTAPILDVLKEKGVTAIFFLTGHYLRTQPELVQRMIDEGHILGNHSNSHKVYASQLSLEESFEDAKWMQDHLRDDFGYEMRLFRFPEGQFCEQSLALIQQMGYKSVFWSFGYNDWNPDAQPTHEAALARITKYLHPGEIMLLHSVSKTNAEILPEVIDLMREKGYEVGPCVGLLEGQ
ncbi:MAG: polysaccharide deacetylase family protein, partial [Oscillospiraceae bacterium]